MPLTKTLRALLMLTLIGTLSGCGFHLKQQYQLPEHVQSLRLESAEFSELTRLLSHRLQLQNIELLPLTSDREEFATLTIRESGISKRTISLYTNAQNAEYEMSYSVNGVLSVPGYKPYRFSVKLHRDFIENPTEALAKSREEQLLISELRGVAADQIVRNLAQVSSLEPIEE